MNLVGHTLGHYQILEAVGRGSMTAAYRAYDAARDQLVVVNVLQDYLRQDPWAQERFRREAEVQRRLNHPGVVRTLDVAEGEGHSYIVKEYIQADSLKAVLERAGRRPLPIRQGLEVLRQVCGALAYAHDLGLLHRDIKPANILLTTEGRVLLTDFGLARLATESPATVSLLGTPEYMPPEIIQGRPEDARSDLYAAGVVLYEMATGQTPFEAEAPMAVLLKHVNEAPPAPRRLNPSLPENIERLLLKALQKRPEDRYQTAAEMAEAATTVLASLPAEPAQAAAAGATATAVAVHAQGDVEVGGDLVGRDKITVYSTLSGLHTLLEEAKQTAGVLANALESDDDGPASRARFAEYYARAQVLVGRLREQAAVATALTNFLNTAHHLHTQDGPGEPKPRAAGDAGFQELNARYGQVIAACNEALHSR